MDNVQFFTDTDVVTGKVTETVLIDRGNGEFTSMLKSAYDEQQAKAEQSTPSVTNGDQL